jgi:hypothetical protein
MWPFDILRKKERQIRRKYKLIIVWCSVGVILITGTIVLPLVLIKKNIYLMIESTSYHVYSQISQSIETVTLCAKTNKGVIIDDAIFNCDDLLSGISLANNQDGSASISGNSNVSGEFTSTINCTSIKISKTDSINIQFSITAIITTKYSLGDTPGEGYSLFSSLPDQNLRG